MRTDDARDFQCFGHGAQRGTIGGQVAPLVVDAPRQNRVIQRDPDTLLVIGYTQSMAS